MRNICGIYLAYIKIKKHIEHILLANVLSSNPAWR